jgi:hypothetical protein
MTDGDVTAEEAASGGIPASDYRVLARSDAPDGNAAVLVLGLGAPDYSYPWECICFRESDGSWSPGSGHNHPSGYLTDDDSDGNPVGVVTLWGDAPKDARFAVIVDRGEPHRVPVREGFYFYAAWNVPPSGAAIRLASFET